jgi:hypothetical protein
MDGDETSATLIYHILVTAHKLDISTMELTHHPNFSHMLYGCRWFRAREILYSGSSIIIIIYPTLSLVIGRQDGMDGGGGHW